VKRSCAALYITITTCCFMILTILYWCLNNERQGAIRSSAVRSKPMTRILERSIAVAFVALAFAAGIRSASAAPLDEIRLDWATYNPVSIVIRTQGLLEKEFEKGGTKVRWVQTLGSNKALEFLNASSIDFGSTAGSAALVARINGNPIKSIYVYSRPEWTALVTRKDTGITKVADLKGKSVAVTRGT